MKMKLKWMLPALVCCLLPAGCARTPETPEERELTLAEERAYTFSDGVSVDRWQDVWDGDRYLLPDGTDLLWVQAPMGPENVVNGHENVDSLSDAARAAVLAWFEDRGLLYDTEQELERAYALYLRCCETGETYQDGLVEQVIAPVGSATKVIYFQTTLTLPAEEPRMLTNTVLQECFDRETGELMSVWDLFTAPEEEARRVLLKAMRPADITDAPESREAIAAAMRPEYIGIGTESIEVWFPRGTLPEGESDGWVLRYEDHPELRDILQPWAIPKGAE